jgi:hypothetical protein
MHQLQQTSRHIRHMLGENIALVDQIQLLRNQLSDLLRANRMIYQRMYGRATEIAHQLGTVVPNPQLPDGGIVIVMMTQWQLQNGRQEGELNEIYQMRSHLEALRMLAAWLTQDQARLMADRHFLVQALGGVAP